MLSLKLGSDSVPRETDKHLGGLPSLVSSACVGPIQARRVHHARQGAAVAASPQAGSSPILRSNWLQPASETGYFPQPFMRELTDGFPRFCALDAGTPMSAQESQPGPEPIVRRPHALGAGLSCHNRRPELGNTGHGHRLASPDLPATGSRVAGRGSRVAGRGSRRSLPETGLTPSNSLTCTPREWARSGSALRRDPIAEWPGQVGRESDCHA